MWGNASVLQTRIVAALLDLHPRDRSTAQESLLLLKDDDLWRSDDGGVHRPSSAFEEPEEERASAAAYDAEVAPESFAASSDAGVTRAR